MNIFGAKALIILFYLRLIFTQFIKMKSLNIVISLTSPISVTDLKGLLL
jgi:hypothetical protein